MGENEKEKLINENQSEKNSQTPKTMEKLFPEFESFDDYVKVRKIILHVVQVIDSLYLIYSDSDNNCNYFLIYFIIKKIIF